MDAETRRLLRAAAATGDYQDVLRVVASMERGAELAQRLAGARAILRDAYFFDVREIARVVANRADELGATVEANRRNLRIDSGSRYALGWPVAWHDLGERFVDLEQAIADSGRLSSAPVMRDMLAVSRGGGLSGSRHLDAAAEAGLLHDVIAEASRLAHRPSLPPLGSRVRFARTFRIDTDEAHEQVVAKNALGTVVDYGGLSGADDLVQTFVWLDDVDFSEPFSGHEIEMFGDETDVLQVV